jgi:hypothetical protein
VPRPPGMKLIVRTMFAIMKLANTCLISAVAPRDRTSVQNRQSSAYLNPCTGIRSTGVSDNSS